MINTTQRVIDIQKRVVVSTFGLADAASDQLERMADIHRPHWVSEEMTGMIHDLFSQTKEWRLSAKEMMLEGFASLEKSFG